jgi:uncharacterized protein YjbI with pentapeptide repeats
MCLLSKSKYTKNLYEKINKYIICYKVLFVDNNRLYSPYRFFKYKSGKINFKTRTIHQGIHVYLTKKQANFNKNTLLQHSVIFKVRCYKEDLIGANLTAAAFRKVYLTNTEYQKTYWGSYENARCYETSLG